MGEPTWCPSAATPGRWLRRSAARRPTTSPKAGAARTWRPGGASRAAGEPRPAQEHAAPAGGAADRRPAYALIAGPADGSKAGAAARPVIVTDLGLTAWRGPQGLAVQARASCRPAAGRGAGAAAGRLDDILAEAATAADGTVASPRRCCAARGRWHQGHCTRTLGDDLVALDLDAAAFDLSTAAPPGRRIRAVDAFAWLDRGIYRPGETVQAAVLLRDGGGAPAESRPGLRVRRPNGSIFAGAMSRRGCPAPRCSRRSAPGRRPGRGLDAGGAGRSRCAGDRQDRVPRRRLRPERLEVTAGPANGPLVPGQPLAVPIAARFLYGAPGAGLTAAPSCGCRPSGRPSPGTRTSSSAWWTRNSPPT